MIAAIIFGLLTLVCLYMTIFNVVMIIRVIFMSSGPFIPPGVPAIQLMGGLALTLAEFIIPCWLTILFGRLCI